MKTIRKKGGTELRRMNDLAAARWVETDDWRYSTRSLWKRAMAQHRKGPPRPPPAPVPPKKHVWRYRTKQGMVLMVRGSWKRLHAIGKDSNDMGGRSTVKTPPSETPDASSQPAPPPSRSSSTGTKTKASSMWRRVRGLFSRSRKEKC